MRTEPSFSAELDNDLLDDEPESRSQNAFSRESDFSSESDLLSDYRQRYGLSSDPFADDPHFPFYTGGLRRQLLDQLLHLCQFSHNLLVVFGEYGVGKTRMAQALIDSLDDADNICFLEGQINSRYDLLFENILEQFELPNAQAFQAFAQRHSEDDSLVVIIVDNAHHLTDAVLAELILLMRAGPETRVHLVLFAEPHLLPRLESIRVPEVGMNDFYLERFSLEEAVDYLNFRMEMADYLGPEIFTEAKVEAWWRQYRGQLLTLHGFAQNQLLASVSSQHRGDTNSGLSLSGMPLPRIPLAHVIGASVLFGALLMGFIYWDGATKPEPSALKELANKKPEPVLPERQVVKELTTSVPVAVAKAPNDVTSKTSDELALAPAPVPAVVPTSVSTSPADIKDTKLSTPKAVTIVKQRTLPTIQADSVVADQSVKNAVKIAVDNKDTADTKANSKHTEQEKTILSWPESDFTVQLVGLSSQDAARHFVDEQSNKKDLLVFRTSRQGRAWYVVVTGHFSTSAKARDALPFLPELQRKANPWPRDVKTIQNEIRQH
jgi:DamX protein